MKFYGGTVTGSLTVNGTQTINGTLTAQTLVVQTITSSISRITGSTQFGSSSVNTHQFTGSVLISGSMGINTTSPIYNDIVMPYAKTSTSTAASFFIRSNEAAASNPFGLRFQIFGSSSLSGRYATLQTTDYNSADGGNIVLQPGGGNVGIGTSNPSRNLVVQNSTSVSLLSIVANPANIAYLLLGDTDSDSVGRVQYDNSSDALQLYTTNTEKMRITSGGAVGIGCTPGAITSLDIQNLSATSNNVFLRLQNNTASEDCGLIISGSYGSAYEHRIGVNTIIASKDLCFTNSSTAGYRWYTDSTQTLNLTSGGLLQVRKNFWQFWVEKSHGSNVNLFSITFPNQGAAIVQIAGSRYSPGSDNYGGTSIFYIYVSNVGVVTVSSNTTSGTYAPTVSVAGTTATFYSAYAGTSTNYTGVSVNIQGSGHNVGNESALTVTLL